jgi:hypothetical protein
MNNQELDEWIIENILNNLNSDDETHYLLLFAKLKNRSMMDNTNFILENWDCLQSPEVLATFAGALAHQVKTISDAVSSLTDVSPRH